MSLILLFDFLLKMISVIDFTKLIYRRIFLFYVKVYILIHAFSVYSQPLPSSLSPSSFLSSSFLFLLLLNLPPFHSLSLSLPSSCSPFLFLFPSLSLSSFLFLSLPLSSFPFLSLPLHFLGTPRGDPNRVVMKESVKILFSIYLTVLSSAYFV